MKLFGAVFVAFLAVGPLSAQYWSVGGFGNVVFPGLGHAPAGGNPWGNVASPAIPRGSAAFSSGASTVAANRYGSLVPGFRSYSGAGHPSVCRICGDGSIERRSRIGRIASGVSSYISRRPRPSKRLTVLPRGTAARPASMARRFRASNRRGGPAFWRQYGKTWKQASMNPSRIAGRDTEREGQIPHASNPLHPRPCGARSTEADPRSYLRGGLLPQLLRISTSAITTPRTGGSQT